MCSAILSGVTENQPSETHSHNGGQCPGPGPGEQDTEYYTIWLQDSREPLTSVQFNPVIEAGEQPVALGPVLSQRWFRCHFVRDLVFLQVLLLLPLLRPFPFFHAHIFPDTHRQTRFVTKVKQLGPKRLLRCLQLITGAAFDGI